MTSRLTNPLAERAKFLGDNAADAATGKEIFTIGELAREFGITLRTLGFYEDKGLINPQRSGMTRLYSRRDRARLKLALLGRRIGFTLTEIRELLDLYYLEDGQTTQLRIASGKFTEQIAKLEKQRADIDAALSELQSNLAIVRDRLAAGKEPTG